MQVPDIFTPLALMRINTDKPIIMYASINYKLYYVYAIIHFCLFVDKTKINQLCILLFIVKFNLTVEIFIY